MKFIIINLAFFIFLSVVYKYKISASERPLFCYIQFCFLHPLTIYNGLIADSMKSTLSKLLVLRVLFVRKYSDTWQFRG